MNPKKNTIAVTFRCDVAIAEQLDEICKLLGCKRSEFLITAITSQYDEMQGNPKMKAMLSQMKQIADTVKQLTGQSHISGSVEGVKNEDGGEA